MAHSQNVNVDGSDDPFYRYTMPEVRVKHEGASKMRKTILVNLAAISKDLGRPVEPLLQHLGQSLSAACNIEGKGKSARPYVGGHHSEERLQEQVQVFIDSCVLCGRCRNPETTLQVTGTKKRPLASLQCGSCGKNTELDPDLKCVKSMMQQAHHCDWYAHWPTRLTAPVDELLSNHAEDSKKQKKKEKMRCAACGHTSSKAVCSRCGEDMPAVSLRPPSQTSASLETANAEEELLVTQRTEPISDAQMVVACERD